MSKRKGFGAMDATHKRAARTALAKAVRHSDFTGLNCKQRLSQLLTAERALGEAVAHMESLPPTSDPKLSGDIWRAGKDLAAFEAALNVSCIAKRRK